MTTAYASPRLALSVPATVPLALRALPQPRRVTSFIERACRQSHDGLRGVRLAGPEVETVEFKEENANHNPLAASADTGQRNLLASFRWATYS